MRTQPRAGAFSEPDQQHSCNDSRAKPATSQAFTALALALLALCFVRLTEAKILRELRGVVLDGGVFSLKRGTVGQQIETFLAGGVLALALFARTPGLLSARRLRDSDGARPSVGRRGDADAQNGLGLMYANGHGAPQDEAQALIWFRKAADQGNTDAQNGLGVMYSTGHGARRTMRGRKVVSQSSTPGEANAQYNLGIGYAEGRGISRDYAQADLWFNLAASLAKDAKTRDDATHNRDFIAKRLNSAELAEAQRMASEWKPR